MKAARGTVRAIAFVVPRPAPRDDPLAGGLGEEVRDFPIYCRRLRCFPEVPVHEAVAELFLPLK